MSTVRHACDTLDVHPHRRLKEAPLCRPPPYGRYPQQSKSRGVPSSAARAMALCWRSIAYYGVLQAEPRRRLRPCCFAHAPVGTGSCGPLALGASGYVSTQTASALLPCGEPSSSLGSCAPWAPSSQLPRVHRAGAAPGGVVPPSQRRSRPNTGSRCQRKPCAAGSTRWAGQGNGPHG